MQNAKRRSGWVEGNYDEYLDRPKLDNPRLIMPASSLSRFDSCLDAAIDSNPLTVSPQTPLCEVIALMYQVRKTCTLSGSDRISSEDLIRDARGSCVLVVDDSRLLGIVTQRDLVRLIATETLDNPLRVSAVMTTELIALRRSQFHNLFTAINFLRQHRIRHLPILSEDEQLLGLVTLESLRSCLRPVDLLQLRRVEEVMSPEVIYAPPDATVKQVAQQLAKYRVSCIAIAEKITNNQLQPLGLVTEADLLLFQALGLDYHIRVDRIMYGPLQLLHPDDNLWEAHQQMQQQQIHHLIVGTEKGAIAGIVTQTTILHALDPMEMYTVIQMLQQQVRQLQGQRVQRLTRQPPQPPAVNSPPEQDLNRAIVETISNLVVVLDTHGRIVRFNKACEVLTGYSLSEVQHQVFWEIFLSPPQQQQVKSSFQNLQTSGFPPQQELTWQTKGLQARTVSHFNNTLCNEKGQVEYVILTGEDITHCRQIENTLKEREESYRHLSNELEQRVHERTEKLTQEIAKYRCTEIEFKWKKDRLSALLSSNPAIIYSCHYQSYKVSFISENVRNILGYKPEEFLSDYNFWWSHVHPEDKTFLTIELEKILEQGYYRYEYRFRHQDGKYRWMRDEVKLIRDEAGNPVELIGYWIEISERKEIEAALCESEQRFRVIFEQAEVGIIAVSPSGNFLLANPKFTEIVGYSVEELLTKTYQEITHPEDLPKDLALVEPILTGKIPRFSFEKRYICKDGSEIWVNLSGSLVRNPKGEPEYIISIIQDISERKKTEAILLDREAILSNLCENTTLMMGVVELINHEIYHLWDNPAAAKLFGLGEQEMKNQSCRQLGIPENLIQLWIKHCNQTQENQKPARFEYLHKTPTGEHWLSATICAVQGENFTHPRCCYVIEEITERKHIEEALRHTTQNLLESQRIAHIGNWNFDVITKQITWSEEMFRIFGLDPADGEPTLEELIEMIHPEDQDHHQQMLNRSLTGGEYFEVEYRLIRPDGELRYLNTQGEVIQNQEGEVIRLFGVAIDVTEQKLAEEALCASEARYRALVEQMPAAVYTITVGEASMPLYISPRIEQMLGYTADEWMSNPQLWSQRLHPEDREQMSNRLLNLPTHDHPFSYEYRLLTRNQDVLWVQDSAVVIRDEDGTPILLQGVMLDITERKQAEVALKQSEERFSTLIRNLSVGVTLHGSQGEVLLCNPKASQLLGLSEEELLGKTSLSAEWEIIHEDGSAFPSRDHPVTQAILTRQAVRNVLMGIYRPSGKGGEEKNLIWILVSAEPQLTEDGKVQHVICTFSDITILKRVQEDLRTSEQLYRTIAHNFPNGTIFLFDRNLRYLVADGQGLAHLQLRREALEGHTLSEALSSEIYTSTESLYQTALDGSERVEEIQHQDQTYLVRAVPIRNEEGEVILGMIVSQNITEQKQAELALQRANQHLAEVNQRLEQSVKELEQRHRESAIINQMIEFLQACHRVEEAYGPISEFLKQLFPDCAGTVLLSNQKANQVESIASFGELASCELNLAFDDCWALRRGQIHLADGTKPGLFCHHVDCQPLPTASICIPTIVQGQAFGLFYLRTQEVEGLSKGQQQLAQTVAEQISLGLSNLQLREELRNQSIRDPLTGLFNRRYLKEFLHREFKRSQRSGRPLGVIMVDIDHFKQFNDNFGHEAGDLVLQEVARFLQRQVRLSDVACRYGGEEMTLVLPEMSLETVTARAQLLCEGIRQLELFYQGQDLGQITASLGVACFPDQGSTPEEVIKKADDALYQAKNQGRNRVVCA
ncbi:PAS domain S-box protein [Capilliphycus salinus ALCB114379]|uniref:PAS domain S-box protein n=1 Tax=Capilliphycus salinus TaxID=2768948 RepID=UPI0039A73937